MSDNETIVFFDLQTTGFGRQCHIIQLSAVCGERELKSFTLPLCPIHEKATEQTGFTVRNGRLFLDGNPVDTVAVFYALTSFINFLRSCRRGRPRRHVLLAAHNAKRFGAPILTRLLQMFSLWHQFKRVVSGFVDMLPLGKRLYPDLPNHQLDTLVKHCLGEDYKIPKPKDAKIHQDLFNSWSQQFGCLDSYLYEPKIFKEL